MALPFGLGLEWELNAGVEVGEVGVVGGQASEDVRLQGADGGAGWRPVGQDIADVTAGEVEAEVEVVGVDLRTVGDGENGFEADA